ncbi:hypothetical protein RMB03_17305 [Acinetobacter sp. V91_7]|uniref:hypothetical protein n=1 Tax=unclassified Acinetobacter TaxID=196816 RepID=UPI00287DD9A1|nr:MULTISPECIES: hypothetical protein [unclassified Acinetobacter]MDS7935686.1 hypothetical protein [Acinetobacter sp. V91_4B]MDS7964706.1 hypothetical protein [Acinetobacter sp. V91_7]MDS8025599.1 hypothetical protein [Acinetobacter sp. V91_13]
MKNYLTLFIIGSVLLSGCSNASDGTKQTEVKTETIAPKTLSAEDQKIIDKHNEYIQKYSMEDKEIFQKHMREILPNVDKITDKRKRELLQMNIYMILNDYEKAHALNDKQLAEKPNDTARLTFRCQLFTMQGKEATLVNKCYDHVAEVLKVELDKPENKIDPDYKIGEFSYLYAKYKAGHPEYKEKMQEYIAETKDEKLKATLTSLYEAEMEN